MTILGIDPSLSNTAVCCLATAPHAVVTRCLGSLPVAADVRSRVGRFAKLATNVAASAQALCSHPALIVIEAYSLRSKGRQHDLTECGAILRLVLLSAFRNVPVIEIPPKALKKFATSNGNAEKPEISRHVKARWGQVFGTNDETDAYVLARMGACYLGALACEEEWQRKVIHGVRKQAKR